LLLRQPPAGIGCQHLVGFTVEDHLQRGDDALIVADFAQTSGNITPYPHVGVVECVLNPGSGQIRPGVEWCDLGLLRTFL